MIAIKKSFLFSRIICFYLYFLSNLKGTVNLYLGEVVGENISILYYWINELWFPKLDMEIEEKKNYSLSSHVCVETLMEKKNIILLVNAKDALHSLESSLWYVFTK